MDNNISQRLEMLEQILGISNENQLILPIKEMINSGVNNHNTVVVKFERVHPDAVIPEIAYEGDACFDLFAVEDVVIPPAVCGTKYINQENPQNIIISVFQQLAKNLSKVKLFKNNKENNAGAYFESSNTVSLLDAFQHNSDTEVSCLEFPAVELGKEFVPVGLKMEIPLGWEATFRTRSSFGVKNALRVHPGTIDAGYRGELTIAVYNMSSEPVVVKKGQGVAQVAVRPVPQVKIIEGTVDTNTQRGDKGFGSSDKV